MYEFILQLLVFSSLSFAIYILARALPRVNSEEDRAAASGRLDRIVAKIPFHKIDVQLTSFLEKFLRRVRVVLLKVDNLLSHHVRRLRASKEEQSSEKRSGLFGGDNKSE